MIRPMTCLSLLAALGAGLYLYQEKHNAQMLDREINRTIKQAEQARDRIGLLKAEWALLNEPERLQTLAGQHLQGLQSLQPAQFARLEDLPGRMPAPSAVPVNTAPVDEAPAPLALPAAPLPVPASPIRGQGPAAAQPVPVALARPAVPTLMAAARAAKPVAPAAVATAAPAVQLTAAPAVQPAAAPAAPKPAAPAVQVAALPAPKPAAPRILAAAKPPETVPTPHPFFAPVMPAYAPTPVIIHAPTVQTASAVQSPQQMASAGSPTMPFIGSALGMARSMLAAPVPVGSATSLGYSTGR